jgi:hypothetical protein
MAAHLTPLAISTFMLVAWRVKKWFVSLDICPISARIHGRATFLYQTIVASDSEADAGANNLEGHCKPFRCRTIYRVIQQSKSFPADSAVRNLFLTWEPPRRQYP